MSGNGNRQSVFVCDGDLQTLRALRTLLRDAGFDVRVTQTAAFKKHVRRVVAVSALGDAIKRQGVRFSPISGDHKLPADSTRDTSIAATRLLLDPSTPIRYDPTLDGPADHDRREAHTIAGERGRTF